MSDQKTTKVEPIAKSEWSIYELAYKKAYNVSHIYFRAPNFEWALAKSQEYCNKRKLRFIIVTEWLKDIDSLISFDGEKET